MLTDTAITKAKAHEKSYKLTDSNGLHLFVATTGMKIWRYRYYFGGKEKLLGLGQYLEVTLFKRDVFETMPGRSSRAAKPPRQ